MGFSCGCDDEYPDVSETTRPKARKEHICHECQHHIQPGEVYWHNRSLFDGIWASYRMCERCDDLIQSFSTLGYCYGMGSFFEDYGDFLVESGDPEGVARAWAIRDKHRHWTGEA